LVISSKQTLVPQFAAASRLSDFAATVAMGGPRTVPSPWCLQEPGPAFCEPSFQILSVNSETISHHRTLFQITLYSSRFISEGQLLLICTHWYIVAERLQLLEVVRQTDDADCNQVDRHHVVEEARHKQDENSRDQSDQRTNNYWVNRHRVSPRKTGRATLIRASSKRSIGHLARLVVDRKCWAKIDLHERN
jgi:hypothetical protein